MSAPRVELVYADDCPNTGEARAQLLWAFAAAGLTPHWREWRADDPACPPSLSRLGSPTILVNRRDVAGGSGGDAACCRVYADDSGKLAGVPTVGQITAALRRPAGSGRWNVAALGAPALGIALLPKLICPACWPAYAAAVTALGLTFLLETRYLLPITIAALALAVLALAWKSPVRRGYGPAILAAVAGAAIVTGKFALDNAIVMYAGVVGFTTSFIWNFWPRRRSGSPPDCPACEPSGRSMDARGGAS